MVGAAVVAACLAAESTPHVLLAAHQLPVLIPILAAEANPLVVNNIVAIVIISIAHLTFFCVDKNGKSRKKKKKRQQKTLLPPPSKSVCTVQIVLY